MKKLRILFIFIVAALVLAQFFSIDKTNPTSDKSSDLLSIEKPSAEVAQILHSSCYDCHSNETVWPWYSNVAPISWIVKKHVVEGRDHINFSEWGDYDQEDKGYAAEEMIEEIEDGEMPILGYDIPHPEAKLTQEKQEVLINWLKTLK